MIFNMSEIPPPEHIYQGSHLRRSGGHLLVAHLGACLETSGKTWGFANDVDSNLLPGHPNRKSWTAQSVIEQGLGRSALIVNYEDIAPSRLERSPMYKELRDTGIPTTDLVLLRDFMNLAATRIVRLSRAEREGKAHTFDVFSLVHARNIWIEQAEMALEPIGDGPQVILYNRLIDRTDTTYREELAARLGLTNSDAALDEVPSYGGGSSVDGQRFAGRAGEMNVFKRWLDLGPEERDWFLGVANDPQIVELNKELFGFGLDEVKFDFAITPIGTTATA